MKKYMTMEDWARIFKILNVNMQEESTKYNKIIDFVVKNKNLNDEELEAKYILNKLTEDD